MRTLPRWRRKTPEQREGAMSLIDHLKELRHRLLICLWALLGGSVIGFILYEPAMRVIQSPYCDFLRDNPDKNPFPQHECSLFFLGAIDAFLITVKVIIFLALVVALPVILYQLWAFIVPGLTARERRWAVPFVALSLILFLLGGLAAYLTLPKALDFLLGVGGDFVSPLLTVDKYIGFVIFTILAFGLVPHPADLPLGRGRAHERDDAALPATGDPWARHLRGRDHAEPRPDLDARVVDPPLPVLRGSYHRQPPA